MSSSGNPQGFPNLSVPVVTTDGRANIPWYYLWRTLWARTGTADGGAVSPTGMIMAYGSTTLPTGWLLCNGAAISRTIYAALYTVIGVTWGSGDGSTTFNLPDFRDRFLIGSGSAAIGTRGGNTSVTLSVGNLPSHSHSVTDPGHAHTTLAAASTSTAGAAGGDVTTGGMTGTATTGITIGNTGSGDPIDFLPPYAAVVWAMKT